MTSGRPVRCAVYTRKSSEHNLDLEFNSLDAQREACEAYIKSQIHEGWILIADHYDDGGISGGSLNRPDLQRLLSDIQAGKVDIVVVYKVDRLTRSLTDFAKLVELFDAHQASFVSITQAFNTTTSMGRLTLNILLSFAQFEREVIGERVRDKIAASKRKGLWMGGNCPLGFKVQDKKLIIDPDEAETVRFIFQRYLALGSAGLLLQELRDNRIKTKKREWASGKAVGGVWFGKGALIYLLKNRAYIGQLTHRGEIHSADHQAILESDLFEAVQAKLQANAHIRRQKLKASPYLLTGLVFDSAGNRMSPSHTLKKGVRYRYYVSQGVLQRRPTGEIARISAPDLEAVATTFVHQRTPVKPGEISQSLQHLIRRITVRTENLEIELHAVGSSGPQEPSHRVNIPWQPRTKRLEKGVTHAASQPVGFDAKARVSLLAAVGQARRWLNELVAGARLSDIASRDGRSERQIRILLNLAFLPPKQVKSLLDGSSTVDTITNTARNVPLVWPEAA